MGQDPRLEYRHMGSNQEIICSADAIDVGVPEDGLALFAAATLHDRGLATNPRPVSDAGPIMSVLRDAW